MREDYVGSQVYSSIEQAAVILARPLVTSALMKVKQHAGRLERLSRICLSLPEALREDCGEHAKFSLRKKTFAYYLYNHHGDGIIGVTCKVMAGDQNRLAEAQPERFYIPAYIGSRGWVGLRLDGPEVDWDEVSELVTGSYLLMAPKKLADLIRARM